MPTAVPFCYPLCSTEALNEAGPLLFAVQASHLGSIGVSAFVTVQRVVTVAKAKLFPHWASSPWRLCVGEEHDISSRSSFTYVLSARNTDILCPYNIANIYVKCRTFDAHFHVTKYKIFPLPLFYRLWSPTTLVRLKRLALKWALTIAPIQFCHILRWGCEDYQGP